jgi:hypothetical protein
MPDEGIGSSEVACRLRRRRQPLQGIRDALEEGFKTLTVGHRLPLGDHNIGDK